MKTKAMPDPKPEKHKRKKSEPMPEGRWDEVVERDNFRCKNPSCEGRILWLEVHHIEKRSRGTNHEPFNLITLCKHCHDLIHVSGKLKIAGKFPDVVFVDI